MAEPLLLVPVRARCPPAGRALAVRAGGHRFAVWTDGSTLTMTPPQGRVEVTGEASLPQASRRRTRAPDLASDTLHRLEALAARTVAPATEASRLRGAGAGGSDTD